MESINSISKIVVIKAKKIIWTLGLHAFLVIIFLIIVDFILGNIVFYKYVFLAEKETPTTEKNVLRFDDKTYQEVLKKLQERAEQPT